MTEREHLLHLKRTSGINHQLLKEEKDIPVEGRRIWKAIHELDRRRVFGGMGFPLPILFSEIACYDKLFGEYLEPWEVKGICYMDSVILSARADLEKDSG